MNILIIGAGGHGRVVLEALRAQGQHAISGFIDADSAKAGTTISGIPVLGPSNLLPRLRRQDIRGVIVAIGDNRIRRSYADEAAAAGFDLVSAIHPSAVVAPSARIGRNVLVGAQAVIGPDAIIGDSSIINTSAVVEHDCRIGRAVHIAPGALLAGRVHVDDNAFIAMGAKILPCVHIGENCTIGAGAVVLENTPPNATFVGVPAKAIRP